MTTQRAVVKGATDAAVDQGAARALEAQKGGFSCAVTAGAGARDSVDRSTAVSASGLSCEDSVEAVDGQLGTMRGRREGGEARESR